MSEANETQQDKCGEIQEDPVVIDIDGMLKKLLPPSEPSDDHCIYRVHQALRQLKPEAYTPQAVSIGPYHHDNPSLKAMEEYKLRYLQIFLTRFNVTLKACVKAVREMEETARNCYKDETSNLSRDEFANMLLVDATFIIILLFAKQTLDDYYYDVFYSPQLILQVTHDMMLLENQLPFFVIEHMFNKFVSHLVDHSLLELTFNLFKDVYNIKGDQIPKRIPSPICKHFTDFLRICLMPPEDTQIPLPPSCSFHTNCKHFTDFLRICPMPSQDDGLLLSIPNAEKLHDAGVTFKRSPSKCLFDIKFNAPTGELQIPFIQLDDNAESFYRNVMAFEMYHQGITKTYVTDCMEFLDDLINTPNDVDLLVDKKIIYNGLGDNQAVATLFNNLLKEIVVNRDEHFVDLCKRLNAYHQFPINRWKAALKRDYFSTPWKTAATIAAVILLLLTLLSTIWTIIK